VMCGASEVIQYQALFISKISPKRKVKTRKLKIEGILEVLKNNENDQMSIFCFQLVFQFSINPQYMTMQKYFSHPSLVICSHI
jgi:hypothetical protein